MVVTLAVAAVVWFVFAHVGVLRPDASPSSSWSPGVDAGGTRFELGRHELAARRDGLASERVVVRELPAASERYSSHLPRRDEVRRRALLADLRRSPELRAEAEEVQEYRTTILHDRDPEERADAILLLSGNEHPKAIRTFVQAMRDSSAKVRLAAVEALGDYAEKLRPRVFAAAMRDRNADVRYEAVDIVGDMKGLQATRLLRVAARDPDGDVRQLAKSLLAYRRRRH